MISGWKCVSRGRSKQKGVFLTGAGGVGLGLAALGLSACLESACETEIPTYGQCIQGVRTEELADGNVRIVFGPPDAESADRTGTAVQPLVVDSARLWPGPKIPVCWDAETYREEDEWKRQAVREAIRGSWERAFDRTYIPVEKRIEFTGWGICTADEQGIRIVVRDERSRSHVGTDHVDYPSARMLLNFTYVEYAADSCGKSRANMLFCMKATAIHEFGHALGMRHEQDRSDTPRACTDSLEGEDRENATNQTGLTYYGQWDQCSIGNYCNPSWNGNGRLSLQDVMWIQLAYIPELAGTPEWCGQLDFIESLGVDPHAAASRSVRPRIPLLAAANRSRAVRSAASVEATVPTEARPSAPRR